MAIERLARLRLPTSNRPELTVTNSYRRFALPTREIFKPFNVLGGFVAMSDARQRGVERICMMASSKVSYSVFQNSVLSQPAINARCLDFSVVAARELQSLADSRKALISRTNRSVCRCAQNEPPLHH